MSSALSERSESRGFPTAVQSACLTGDRSRYWEMSFESNLARLEQIVAQLEGNRLELSASLGLFEEGIELLRQASDELNETKRR